MPLGQQPASAEPTAPVSGRPETWTSRAVSRESFLWHCPESCQEKKQPWGTPKRLLSGCSDRSRSCAEGTGLNVSCSKKATATLAPRKDLKKTLKKTPNNALDFEIQQRPHQAQSMLLETLIFLFFFFCLGGLLSINASSFNPPHPNVLSSSA